MTGRRDLALCVLLAAALHLAAFAAVPSPEGGASGGGGEGGDASVTMIGADAALAALVADWDRPPEARPASTRPAAPQVTPPPDIAIAPPPIADLPIPQAQPPVPAPPRAEAPLPPAPRPRPEAFAGSTPPAKAAAPSQQAAGSGGGASAPAATSGAGHAPGARETAFGAWKAAIQRALAARLPRIEGASPGASAEILIAVAPDGGIRTATIARSFGHPLRDAALRRAVRGLETLPPGPAGLTDPEYEFRLPVIYPE